MFASRCNCSTRALERFLWDCAGLQLRASHQRQTSISLRRTLAPVASIRSFSHTGSLAAAAKQKRSPVRSSASSPTSTTAVKPASTKKSKSEGKKATGPPKTDIKTSARVTAQKEVSKSRLLRKERRKKDGIFRAGKGKTSSTCEQNGVIAECKQDKLEVSEEALEQRPTVATSVSVTSDNGDTQRDQVSGAPHQPSRSESQEDSRTTRNERLTRRERRMAQKVAAKSPTTSAPAPAEGPHESQVEHLESILSKIDIFKSGTPSGLSEPSILAGMENNARPRPKPRPVEAQPDSTKSKSETPHKNTTAIEMGSSRPAREPWQIQKAVAKRKFGETGWAPRKRLSPDSLNGIRALHAADPVAYSPKVLANQFSISPEAIQRILRSKWRPSEDEAADRMARWERRGERKWSEMAAKGLRPPRRWRATLGIPSRNPRMGRRLTGAGGVKVATSAEQSRHGDNFMAGVPREWLQSTKEDENAGTAFADRIA